MATRKKFTAKICTSWDGSYFFGHMRHTLPNGLCIDITTNLHGTKKWGRKELKAAMLEAIDKHIK